MESFLASLAISSVSSASSVAVSSSIDPKLPSALGSFFSSSGSSSSSSGKKRKGVQCNPGVQDKKFSEIIKDTPYTHFKKVPVKYIVSISRKFCGHWFLIFEMEGAEPSLPNFSLEVSTPDVKSLKREIYTDNDTSGSTYCGTIDSKLCDILDVADRIVVKMGHYSLFTSNCQHFCNNLLHHYGFAVYRTTLGKDVTEEMMKLTNKTPDQLALLEEIEQELKNGGISDDPLQQPSQSELETRMRGQFASLLNRFVGAN